MNPIPSEVLDRVPLGPAARKLGVDPEWLRQRLAATGPRIYCEVVVARAPLVDKGETRRLASTASGSRRPYSKARVARIMGIRPERVLEKLKRFCPDCVIIPPGSNQRIKIDADLFDRFWESRRGPALERRRLRDQDWIEHKLAEEFPT